MRLWKGIKLHLRRLMGETEAKAIFAWRKAGANQIFASLQLKEGASVFDVGGFKGDFAAQMVDIFDAKVRVFDPEFHQHIKERFINHINVSAYNFGLSDVTGYSNLSKLDDGSSIIRNSKIAGTSVRLEDIVQFLETEQIEDIDLLKLNVEGAEFGILDRLIDSNRMNTFRSVLVQFHSFSPDAYKRRDKIREELAKKYECVWNFPFVWEYWTLTEIDS